MLALVIILAVHRDSSEFIQFDAVLAGGAPVSIAPVVAS
jgi:hypothetical protein